jgi:hypothetical protein
MIIGNNIDDLLIKYSQGMALKKVPDRDYESVRKWMATCPALEKEMEYFHHKDDLVSIRSSDAGNPHSKIEEALKWGIKKLDWPCVNVRRFLNVSFV